MPTPSRLTHCVVRCSARVTGWFLVMAFVGCQQWQAGWHNPFARDVPAYKQDYGPTPRQRMESMRQLGQRAATMAEGEQSRTIHELASVLEEDPDPMLRRTAVIALGQFHGPEVDVALQRSLHDPEADVRAAACEVCGMRGSSANNTQNMVLLLRERVNSDTDPEVRRAAVAALASLRTYDSLQSVAAALEDQDPAMQVMAINALKKVTGQELGNDVNAWSAYVKNLPKGNSLPDSPSAGNSEVQLATAIE